MGMKELDAVVIGGGLGGLLCGDILSKEGLHTVVLEKHHTPGGNLQCFHRAGHPFETGIHYIGGLGVGEPLHRYWSYAGLLDRLETEKLDENGFDIIKVGDAEFPLAQGTRNFIDQLLPYFPKAQELLSTYTDKLEEVAKGSPLYNLELPVENSQEPQKTQGAWHYYQTLADKVFSKNRKVSLACVLSGNRFLYAGDEATSLHTAAIINHSFIHGAYRITRGSDEITKRLVEQIAQHGGKVLVKKEVEWIEKKDTSFHVRTSDGEVFHTKRVVSAIHPATTLNMVPESMFRPSYRQRILRVANTNASLSLHLLLKPERFPYLNKNIYLYEESEWKNSGMEDSLNFIGMLSMPVPKGGNTFAETATILTYDRYSDYAQWAGTTSGRRGEEYLAFKQKKADQILKIVERYFPSLIAAISAMWISTPLTYRDYTGTPEGSLYGIRRDYRDPLTTTILPATKVPGFFFTGQNTNLHGALGVTIGAVTTCGAIVGIDHLLKKIRNG